jgi:predicted XRE-type DNA-binding protein
MIDRTKKLQEGDCVMATKKKGLISAETLDEFMDSQGLLEEAQEVAIKRVLAWQIAEAMKEQGMTKTAMATRMRTDRRQLDRLLDPENPSVTLSTLLRAAEAVGRTLRIELYPREAV